MKKILLFLLSAVIVLLFYLLTLLMKGADRLFNTHPRHCCKTAQRAS